MKPPVVVVPGITATGLRDTYPPDPERVWRLLGKDYLRIALHPDDTRWEQIEPARIEPDEVFGVPYDEYVKELRHDLSAKRDEPRPVYLFAHDWRQPLDLLAEGLRLFCDEVAARTALMRHYAKDGYTAMEGQVDLVGHSMGGLIVTGYLATHPEHHRARKVVTMGTPFGGSFEAVVKMITGTADLGGGVPSSREREVARLLPSLYHLLPEDHLPGAITVADGLPDTLFDPDLWQPSVVESIAEHIRLHGVDPPRSRSGRLDEARTLFARLLDRARAFRRKVDAFDPAAAGLGPVDWMAVVGVGEETRTRLEIERRDGAPFFRLRSLDRQNGYPEPERDDDGTITAALHDTGDGTVPYWAARPPFLETERLVAVSPDDFGYWELSDRLLRRFATTLHGMLPAMNRVIKLSVAFLDAPAGEKGRSHPGIRGRRAPELPLSAEWNPPIRGLEEEEP